MTEDELSLFKSQSYLVIPDALTRVEVDLLNAAIDEDRNISPLWQNRGGGRHQNPNLLLTTSAFDRIIRHPSVLTHIERLLGSDACFEEFSVMLREPTDVDQPAPNWHRDTKHLPDQEFALFSLCVIYYLTDVTDSTHCFSIVPESVDAKRSAPEDREGSEAVDLHGSAGTAILYNAASVHDARQRVTTHERRTVHIYFGHTSQPALSKHTIVPRRLTAGAEKAFYSRINEVSQRVHASFG